MEDQINATIPNQVKNVAKTCLKKRINELKKIMDGKAEVNYDKEYIKKVKDKISKTRENTRKKEEIYN